MSELAPPNFDPVECVRRAEAVFAKPPARDWIRRPEPEGVLVLRFAVPLELLPTSNFTSRDGHAQGWRWAKLKTNLFAVMWRQCPRFETPLTGRPMVRCVRFSARAPDAYSNSFKAAIDILCKRTDAKPKRLNVLEDDKPACIDERHWWEPMPQKDGFGMIEIYSGKDEAIETARAIFRTGGMRT